MHLEPAKLHELKPLHESAIICKRENESSDIALPASRVTNDRFAFVQS